MSDRVPHTGFSVEEARCASALVDLALSEDLGPDSDDITSRLTIPAWANGSARIIARAPGVLSGSPVASMLADRQGLSLEIIADGSTLERGTVIGRLFGSDRAILGVERTLLNFLQRLSGVASLTARYVDAVRGTRAVILDTRKTTPGWRALEKYAVRCGGGRNHRIGLYDAVLIKDNHLAALAQAVEPIGDAVSRARQQAPAGMVIEVEVDSLDQLDLALACRPDIILIDNFSHEHMVEAVSRRDARAPDVLLEASGGVNLETVASIARAGVDRISIGALTHSAPALDIALDHDD